MDNQYMVCCQLASHPPLVAVVRRVLDCLLSSSTQMCWESHSINLLQGYEHLLRSHLTGARERSRPISLQWISSLWVRMLRGISSSHSTPRQGYDKNSISDTQYCAINKENFGILLRKKKVINDTLECFYSDISHQVDFFLLKTSLEIFV